MTPGFALAMAFVPGVQAPLNYAVFVCAGASFLLFCAGPDPRSLDALLARGSRDA